MWALAALVPSLAHARSFYEFQTPVTPVARDTLHVHDLFLGIIVVVYGLGLAFLFTTLVLHRKGSGRKPSTFTAPKTALGWFLCTLPFLALVFTDYVIMGIPAYHAALTMADTRTDAGLVVKITGHQWKWEYEYPAQKIDFTSSLSTPQDQIDGTAPKNPNYLLEVDKPLVLPVGVKVRLLLTSTDVIHSWWMPSFGVKQDAIPGFLRESWVKIEQPGTYRGQCGELCGMNHAYMPIVVEAKSPADFQKWVADQQAQQATAQASSQATLSHDELMTRGKKAFEGTCAACHQVNGLGVPGAFPAIAGGQPFTAAPEGIEALTKRGFYAGGKIVVGPVADHLGIVLNGIPGTAMAAFGAQLSDADIAAIVTYERNSFGNHTGDTVQPADVTSARSPK
jgi:cytochrome c oxidase subunit 2